MPVQYFPEFCGSFQRSIKPKGVMGNPEFIVNWSEVWLAWGPPKGGLLRSVFHSWQFTSGNKCVVFPRTNNQASNCLTFSWVSCNLIQFSDTIHLRSQHQIPQVKGSVPKTLLSAPPPPLQMPITSAICHLCFCPTSYKSKIPTTIPQVRLFAIMVHRTSLTCIGLL